MSTLGFVRFPAYGDKDWWVNIYEIERVQDDTAVGCSIIYTKSGQWIQVHLTADEVMRQLARAIAISDGVIEPGEKIEWREAEDHA